MDGGEVGHSDGGELGEKGGFSLRDIEFDGGEEEEEGLPLTDVDDPD